MEIGCAICQESFAVSGECDATKCGHVFHKTCIAAWTQHSKTCPTCRASTQRTKFTRIYFNTNMSEQAIQTDELLKSLTSAGEREVKLQADLAAAGEREAAMQSELDELRAQVPPTVEPYAMYVKAQLVHTANGSRLSLQGISREIQCLPGVQQQINEQWQKFIDLNKGSLGPTYLKIVVSAIMTAFDQREAELQKEVAAGVQRETQLRREVTKLQSEVDKLQSEVVRLREEVARGGQENMRHQYFEGWSYTHTGHGHTFTHRGHSNSARGGK